MMSDIYLRWMIKSDMPEVLEIEDASFEFPWTKYEFTQCLRNRNRIGMVATMNGPVVGFMIYELHQHRVDLLSLAVAPENRRGKVGTAMVNKLIDKLSDRRRDRITLNVRETNIDAQLFFRHHGFRAISIMRNWYEGNDEDAYLMQRTIKTDATSFFHYSGTGTNG